MATLPRFFDNFMGAGTAENDAPRSVTWETSEEFKLRALPNEDVYLFTKRIDNSRIVRQADPKARARDWRLVGGAALTSVVLIGLLLPSAYGLMAGYQLSQLELENQRLKTERNKLEYAEARLLSAEHLQEIAKRQGLDAPSPERTVYLAPKDEKSLALNRP
jgi:hypothetical protein